MSDDEVEVPADSTHRLQDSPRLCAAERAEEPTHLRAALSAGEPIGPDDVAAAQRRLEEAHMRAYRAHQSAAREHRRAAEAHNRAAEIHAAAAAAGKGDVHAHRRAAEAHCAARDEEYQHAETASQLADREAAYARSASSKTP